MVVLLLTLAHRAPGSPARSSSRRRGAWSRAGSRWTHELVAYALDRFHARHLRTPTLRELRAGLDEMPSYATIKRMYGNTSAMFEHHGYRARRAGAQRGRLLYVDQRDSRGRFLSNSPS